MWKVAVLYFIACLSTTSVQGVDLVYSSPVVIVANVSGITRLNAVDISFDGDRDLLTGGPNRLTSITRNKEGKFGKPVNYGKYVRGVQSVEFLKSAARGAGSVVVACSRGKNPRPTGAIQLVKDNGRGKAPSVKTLVTLNNFSGRTKRLKQADGHDVKVLDIDDDGKPDIVATVSGISITNDKAGFLLYWRNTGQDVYTLKVLDEELNGDALLETGDFNGDGRHDIAVLAQDRKQLYVYLQAANGGFTKKVIDSKVEASNAIATGRFNKDDRFDIFLLGETKLTGYLAKSGTDAFTKTSLFTFNPKDHVDKNFRNFQLKLHDVNGDNLTDIALIYGKQAGLRWMKQLPNSKLSGPSILVNVKEPTAFDIANMNKDDIADMVVYSSKDRNIYQSTASIKV